MVKLFLIITSAFFTACGSHAPQKAITKKNNRMTCFERLDTAEANKRILEYRKKEEQEFLNVRFMTPATNCSYTDSMGYTVYLCKNDSGYLKTRWKAGNLFGEYRYYFLNGNIQETGEYFLREFNCGRWREYDIDGNLIKETDMDKPYKGYSWQNIMLFIKKRNIDLYDEETNIDRYVDEANVPYWYITWFDRGIKVFHDIIIDARNGYVVKDGISHRVECCPE